MKILNYYEIFEKKLEILKILKFYEIYEILENTYRIKCILFSILSLSGPLSGEPDRVILSLSGPSSGEPEIALYFVIYIQNSLKHWKKKCFAVTEKISDLNYLFPYKNYSFLGLLFFSVF